MNESPKEVARQLVDEYNDLLQGEMTCLVFVRSAKKCALKTVDKIIESMCPTAECIGGQFINYWNQVKEEINQIPQ